MSRSKGSSDRISLMSLPPPHVFGPSAGTGPKLPGLPGAGDKAKPEASKDQAGAQKPGAHRRQKEDPTTRKLNRGIVDLHGQKKKGILLNAVHAEDDHGLHVVLVRIISWDDEHQHVK